MHNNSEATMYPIGQQDLDPRQAQGYDTYLAVVDVGAGVACEMASPERRSPKAHLTTLTPEAAGLIISYRGPPSSSRTLIGCGRESWKNIMANASNPDIELGDSNELRSPLHTRKPIRCMLSLRNLWSRVRASAYSFRHLGNSRSIGRNVTRRFLGQIEDRASGYPRYSALIASHDHFYLCRRFSELRARSLLLKQDKLSKLESHLRKLDDKETEPLYLSSCRVNGSSQRDAILLQIDEALSDYDEYIIRNRQILELEAARPQAVLSLKRWTDGNPCIARAETKYLDEMGDLITVSSEDDTVITWLESVMEKALIWFRPLLQLDQEFGISNDPKVHIMPQASIARAARVLMTPFIVTLLLAPVIICNYLDSLTARLVVIVSAASIFIAVLSGSTRAKATELVVAGATYTTVLIVFITSTSVTLQEQM
ncbi:hypothetical protein OPT61_g5358 [Boeremia exigua]|uniref:Uncharacterized protein n=1 Tax=Boeremia exigua TaxID=749465 RepID=A0ACC2IAJ8_9PLEO|nr:hypothetical protein OPT61_g5358 [Boeremia exigua]